jgi:hypothetical protein
VLLADIACKLSLEEASRYLDPEKRPVRDETRRLVAPRLAGTQRGRGQPRRAEGVRLAYVAATRARDILILPAVGDGPVRQGWIRPLNRALYPPRDQWPSPAPARGVPLFKGKQTIMPDARADGQPVDDTVRPGTYQLADPETGRDIFGDVVGSAAAWPATR